MGGMGATFGTFQLRIRPRTIRADSGRGAEKSLYQGRALTYSPLPGETLASISGNRKLPTAVLLSNVLRHFGPRTTGTASLPSGGRAKRQAFTVFQVNSQV
jgi:hypothetical protein